MPPPPRWTNSRERAKLDVGCKVDNLGGLAVQVDQGVQGVVDDVEDFVDLDRVERVKPKRKKEESGVIEH